MFTKKTSTRAILKNLLVALAALSVAVIVVIFMSNQITKIVGSLTEKKKAAFFLSMRTQILANLRADLEKIGANDKKLEQALPPDDNISGFLSTLKSVADQNGLQQNIQVSTPVALTVEGDLSISQIDYTIALNGTVVTLEAYLKAFEAMPYFAAIRSFSINAPSGWEGNSSISIRGQIYARQSNL